MKYRFLALFVALFLVGICQQTANANQSFKVHPIKENILLEAGESKEITLLYSNTTSGDKKINLVFKEFTVDDSNTPIEQDPSGDDSAVYWISGYEEQYIVEAGQEQKIIMQIDVPAEAQARGYYIDAISSVGANEQEQIAANTAKQEFHTLYSFIVGQPAESLEIIDIKQSQGRLDLIVANNELVHSSLSGQIELFEQGKTEVLETVTVQSANIFPEDERTIAVSLPDSLEGGQKYQAKIYLAYGRQIKLLEDEFLFTYEAGEKINTTTNSKSDLGDNSENEEDKKDNELFLIYGVSAAIILAVVIIAGGVLIVSKGKKNSESNSN